MLNYLYITVWTNPQFLNRKRKKIIIKIINREKAS